MEEKRAPLSEMAIERKIQILRNKHMDSEVIALVKSDYEYGLTVSYRITCNNGNQRTLINS